MYRISLKLILRKVSYSKIFQSFIANIIICYMFIVYKTSKREFINLYRFVERSDDRPIIALFWHNRLMMIPFMPRKLRKRYPSLKFMTLSSRHGDGAFVGKVMNKFKFITINGSTRRSRANSKKGIKISGIRAILSNLSNRVIFGMTPDGPIGPAKKINGEIISIAKITNARIVAISYSSSRNIILKKTWDKFFIPLPFSKIIFYCDEKFFDIDSQITPDIEDKVKQQIIERMNFVESESLFLANDI